MKTFTPAQPGSRSSSGSAVDVLAHAADEESKVAMHAMTRALDFVGERLRGHRQRIGVWHFEHRGDAAHHRAARSGFQVLLVGEARLAEMHLGVDHARQDVQATAVDRLPAGFPVQIAERSDPPARNADIAGDFAVLIDDNPALEDEIVSLRHALFLRSLAGAALERLPRAPYVSRRHLARTLRCKQPSSPTAGS